jgi:benzoyl-CoA 2,3-dioxygenase component A
LIEPLKMSSVAQMVSQHLIDPKLCIRCNACEETCSRHAITHDWRNHAVDPSLCDGCGECVQQCPTGAADHWRIVPAHARYTVMEQLAWSTLPSPELVDECVSAAASSGALRSVDVPALHRYECHSPAAARLVCNRRITAPDADSDVHHLVLDFGAVNFWVLEGQSVGILPPGMDLHSHPHGMRMYSVASARSGEAGVAGHVALTIKRVTRDSLGQPARGVCSNYLCDLEEGASVRVVGPFGSSFLLPESSSAKLVLVATGTGIAPMRAMLAQRRATAMATAARAMLFYGARTPGDMAYLDELQQEHGRTLELYTAFSRSADAPRRHVHEVMAEHASAWLDRLVREGGYLYVCGLKGLETSVLDVLQRCCELSGLDWNALHDRLVADHRLHIETY